MKQKCALVCIANDEDNYIQEWVDYHIKIGFSDIFVWQNNWRSQVLSESSNIHLRIIDGDYKQVECYNLAIDELHDKYDWIAFFDIDEFLVVKNINGFTTIDTFLSQNKYDNIPCICVNWRIFGDSGLTSIDSWSVLNRFIMSDDKLDETSKVIIHTSYMKNMIKFFYNPHCVNSYQYDPNLKFRLDRIGNNKHIIDNGNIEPIELNHYRNKTYTEQFIRHFQKPCTVNDPSTEYTKTLFTINKSFNYWNKNTVINTNARDFFNG